MRPSLSVRIAESADRKDVAAVPIEALAPLASSLGFRALCMRASVVSVDSPPERVAEVRALLDRLGLAVSMVTGDLALAANTGHEAVQALRNISPYLDLAERMGSPMLRVMMHTSDDIPRAQRAADEARERNLRLAHQLHWGTLFETVDGALETARAVGRPNFGLTYEPANLLVCGDDWGPAAIRRLAPHIINVYFQNMQVDDQAPLVWPTRTRGPVRCGYLPVADPNGTDLAIVIRGLKDVGYDGWFTIHQPLQPGQSVEQAAREGAEALHGLL